MVFVFIYTGGFDGVANNSIVNEWLTDDSLLLLEAWARDGCTLQTIADKIGVDYSTLNDWKRKYPKIKDALAKGKELIDYKVENALLKSALGYKSKEIKVIIGKQIKNGVTVDLTKETTIREVAPNVTACAMWLNNRRPDKWKRNRDNTIELDNDDNNLSITIVRGGNKQDNINNEIKIEAKKEPEINEKDKNENSDKKGSNRHEKKSIKQDKDINRDFWPDDWEEE